MTIAMSDIEGERDTAPLPATPLLLSPEIRVLAPGAPPHNVNDGPKFIFPFVDTDPLSGIYSDLVAPEPRMGSLGKRKRGRPAMRRTAVQDMSTADTNKL